MLTRCSCLNAFKIRLLTGPDDLRESLRPLSTAAPIHRSTALGPPQHNESASKPSAGNGRASPVTSRAFDVELRADQRQTARVGTRRSAPWAWRKG